MDAAKLARLFARYDGQAVTLEDADGNRFISTEIDALIDSALTSDDPYIDLVGSDGIAIGLTLNGDPSVVSPEPSFPIDGGMAFILAEGQELAEQERGKHFVPVEELMAVELHLFELQDLTINTPGSEMEIVLSQGRHRMEKQGQWKPVRSMFGQFSDVLQAHTEGKKDGTCFLQGEAAGGTRKAMAMVANYIIGVDLDSGKPIDEVMNAIIDAGLEAVVYTTHSHLKDTSEIKRDHFLKWAGTDEPTVELVAEYLQTKKGLIPEVTKNIEILNDSHHTEEGVVILVKHDPIPKFRAVFPLNEPFVFAKRGGAQKDALAEWKERYAGFSTEMGFFFDETCADPARLFYLPRHKAKTLYGSWWVAGRPVELDKYERIKVKRDRRVRSAADPDNAFAAYADGEDEEDDRNRYVVNGVNLVGWARQNAKFFEVESFLTDMYPEAIREVRGGKAGVHVECPFEAEHSNFGGGGSFVVNASDNYTEGYEGGFTFTCVHDACSHRDRLDMLKGCIEEDWFTAEELENSKHIAEVETDEDDDYIEDAPPFATGNDKPKSTPAPVKTSAYEEPADEAHLDDETKVIRDFNRKYAVVVTSGGVKILQEPKDAKSDTRFLTRSDVSLLAANNILFVKGKGGKTERIDAFKLWLESKDRRTFEGVEFLPGKTTPPDIYNLFRGFPIEPVQGDWSLLRTHLFENICDSEPELFDWFMTWMAQIIQEPWRKPGSTLVVTGEKGTGKSTLFFYLSKLLGRHAITAGDRKLIVGSFNGHLSEALLMVCEEAFWAADAQAEGSLKNMITSEDMLIEKKGYDAIKSKNYTRMALISNSDWVVPASLNDERRFGVFRCSSARKGKKNEPYWQSVEKQMWEQGGLQAMMFELLHYQPMGGSFSCLYHPPVTKHLQKQQVETLTGVDKFMLDLIIAGSYEPTNDNIDPIELNNDRETEIYCKDMRSCVEDFVRMSFQSDKAGATYDNITVAVKSWFDAQLIHVAPEGGGSRKRLFRFPPLDECREQLKERKGLDIEVIEVEQARKSNRPR